MTGRQLARPALLGVHREVGGDQPGYGAGGPLVAVTAATAVDTQRTPAKAAFAVEAGAAAREPGESCSGRSRPCNPRQSKSAGRHVGAVLPAFQGRHARLIGLHPGPDSLAAILDWNRRPGAHGG